MTTSSALNRSEFATRRKDFMRQMAKNSIAILHAAPECIRNGDVHYPYRPSSDFYYLTGFTEPQAIAVFLPGRREGEYILFNRPRDPQHEIWNGKLAGQEGARTIYGADQSFSIKEFDRMLPELLYDKASLYHNVGHHADWDQRIMSGVNYLRKNVRTGQTYPRNFVDISPLLAEMRLIKSPMEISMLRKAASISAKAHCLAMQRCKPNLYEYHLEAELLREFVSQGSRAVAYDSIVAGGENGCVLHYRTNNDQLNDGDLVLVDAGCEFNYYASDITRTFPVNGRFSPEQKAIYELVLAAQTAGIANVRPGIAWNKIQTVIIKIITEGLVKLGILNGNIDRLIENKAYETFYMHNSGHWLGLDVHDVGVYKINNEWRPLKPGMVLTVEPGIYIAKETPNVDKKWCGIGVRIEDDVLVTTDGHDVLSADAPKTVDEIEKLMADVMNNTQAGYSL